MTLHARTIPTRILPAPSASTALSFRHFPSALPAVEVAPVLPPVTPVVALVVAMTSPVPSAVAVGALASDKDLVSAEMATGSEVAVYVSS